MQFFFAITLFVSATLLFLVQPMFAKMALPLLGGTPAVWNTCMVFYQAVLLAGYVYAHFSIRFLGVRRQAAVHLGLLCLPWLVLPIAIPNGWTPPAEGNPVGWLLLLLGVAVGLPFLVVSASAPMLQAWFANTRPRSDRGRQAAKDPYFLYAASNLGSMIALLGYPVVMEPGLTLGDQSWAWAVGYALLTLLMGGCAVVLWRSRRTDSTDPEPAAQSDPSPTGGQRLRWLILSFAPSSLLLGVTTHISTDIASVPLLWVVPLALYLLTFVLVFARRTILPHRWMVRLQPMLVMPVAILFFLAASHSVWVLLPLHLATFFVTAMVCHGELAAMRPGAARLTEFYLFMSIGGVLGGLFNAIVAPSLFATIIEYPLVIATACMLRPRIGSVKARVPARWLDLGLPLAVVLLWGGLGIAVQGHGLPGGTAGALVFLATATLAGFSFQDRPLRFGLGVGALMLVSFLYSDRQTRAAHVERNFFGVLRVSEDPQLNVNVLVHGSTNHGMQFRDPRRRGEPLTYYHRTGPLGQVLEMVHQQRRDRRIGVIGLGAGSIACYGRVGQQITFYEIDPAVERLARDPRYFTFLEDSRAEVDVVLGDGRLSLMSAPERHFNVLVLDAFSSDAIPMHLITREALELYFSKLADDGVLVMHLTNSYLDLEPIVGALARDAGVVCRIQDDGDVSDVGKSPSRWAVMAGKAEHLDALLKDPRWRPIPDHPGVRVWTDGYSNILSVLQWR